MTLLAAARWHDGRVVTLQTPRLLLRRWREADVAPLAAINGDPEVMRWIGTGVTRDVEQTRASVAANPANLGQALMRGSDHPGRYHMLTDWTDETAFRSFERSAGRANKWNVTIAETGLPGSPKAYCRSPPPSRTPCRS